MKNHALILYSISSDSAVFINRERWLKNIAIETQSNRRAVKKHDETKLLENRSEGARKERVKREKRELRDANASPISTLPFNLLFDTRVGCQFELTNKT